MITSLYHYIAPDRARALARGEELPDRTTGSALLAGVDGLTSLAEDLVWTLGPQRGVEELIHHLDLVYDALIAEVERQGGSVIGFADDALLCWFDSGPATADGDHDSCPEADHAAWRAAACALAMRAAMQAFDQVAIPSSEPISLALKVAIASGPARRLAVGDGAIQRFDVLAGSVLERMRVAQGLADRGDVVVDEATAARVELLTIVEWRATAGGQQFAVAGELRQGGDGPGAVPAPGPFDQVNTLSAGTLRGWLPPAAYEWYQAGTGRLFSEMRPAVALFLQFTGLDCDADDDAGQKLDAYVRWVQHVLGRYDGVLMDLTMGDQSGRLYATFGALTAHEDNTRRAASAALALRLPPVELGFVRSTQIGLSQGMMRVGAYGGTTRRAFGVLGTNANVAMRLMAAAAPGQIVVSGAVRSAAAESYAFDPIPAVYVEGKSQPVSAFVLGDVARHRDYRLLNPFYNLPLIGRQAEMEVLASKLDLAGEGYCQIVTLTAEAGLGKSRLVAEAIRLAQRRGFSVYGSGCQPDGVNTPYQVWRPLLASLFDVDIDAPLDRQAQRLAVAVERLAPQRLASLPLLATTLGLSLPDNDFTRGLEPRDRKSALEATMVDCLQGMARAHRRLLFVFEDLHWMDGLSHDLLEAVGWGLSTMPLLILLTYRPPEIPRLAASRLEALPYITEIMLAELPAAESVQLIRAHGAQLYPGRQAHLPAGIEARLVAQAQGNPFYLEEILNYWHNGALDPYDPAAGDRLKLPDSLRTLILSRIDQLAEREKMVLKAASIIGREFKVSWLHGYYPALGDLAGLKSELDRLRQVDMMLLHTLEPEPAYLFKHVITHQVTYESLPHATRAQLHEQLARYLETTYPAAPLLDTLAYHYGQSDNLPKKIEYLRMAGEAARAAFANDAAVDYYAQLLPLLVEPAETIELRIQWGAVLELMGNWEQAETHYWKALTLAQAQDEAEPLARCQFALGRQFGRRADYALALEWLEMALAGWTALDDEAMLCQILSEIGTVHRLQGDYALARQHFENGMAWARALGATASIATGFNDLGIVAYLQGDFVEAQAHYEASLELCRAAGNKQGIAAQLNNLGIVTLIQGNPEVARAQHEESLAIKREMGDKPGAEASLHNLGDVALAQGDYPAARALYAESLKLCKELGHAACLAAALSNLANVSLLENDHLAALPLYEESLTLRQELGEKRGTAIVFTGLALLALARGETALAHAHMAESLHLRQEMADKRGIATCLAGFAGVAIAAGAPRRAARLAGATEKLLAAIQSDLRPEVRPTHKHAVDAARAALGEEAFAAAWAEGAGLAMEEAMAYALETAENELP